MEPRSSSTWTRSTAGPPGATPRRRARSSAPCRRELARAFVPARRRLDRAVRVGDHDLDDLGRELDELREGGGSIHAGARS